MTSQNKLVQIETDLFIFELPEGWQIETLGEEAELIGNNDEFMMVSTYSIEEKPSNDVIQQFKSNISNAMNQAVEDPELTISRPLKGDKTADGLPILSLLAQTDNQQPTEYFDQYSIIHNSTAVLVTVEGDINDRSSSALVEEAIYDIYFK